MPAGKRSRSAAGLPASTAHAVDAVAGGDADAESAARRRAAKRARRAAAAAAADAAEEAPGAAAVTDRALDEAAAGEAAGGGAGAGAAGTGSADAAGAGAAGADADADARRAAKRARRAAFKADRRARLLATQSLRGGPGAVLTPAAASPHPFAADPRDHAETPFEAYRDIEPLLFRLAGSAGKAGLRIYDPFYCEGSVKRHLGRLGFPRVVNENRDFYADVRAGAVPPHDVVVTNPPFSGDHVPRALAWAAANGKPFFLLLPDFAARKASFAPALAGLPGGAAGLAYVGPRTRAYAFAAPGRDRAAARAAGAGAGAGESAGAGAGAGSAEPGGPPAREDAFSVFATSFQCVWFVHLGGVGAPAGRHDALVSWWERKYGGGGSGGGGGGVVDSALARGDPAGLPQLAPDRLRKRREQEKARPWRKKLLRQRKAAAKATTG